MLFGKESRGTYTRSFFPWLRLFLGFGMHGSNIYYCSWSITFKKECNLSSETCHLNLLHLPVAHWKLSCDFLEAEQWMLSGVGTEMQGLSHGPTGRPFPPLRMMEQPDTGH